VACMAVIAGAGTAPAAHGADRVRVITSGVGTVTSADGRIDCGDDCSATYHGAPEITLKAVPGSGFVFAHWKGACFGKSPKCVVAATRRTTVRAKFERLRRLVRLVVSGPGTVVSEPRGLYCGSAQGVCAAGFRHGTTVRLTAVPDVGGVFHAWGGTGCQGQVSTTCEFVVPGDVDLTTTFRNLAPDTGTPTLTVALSGGRVTSSPPGIDCPPTCSAAFPSGTPVTLTAAGDIAWTAGCKGAGVTCALIVDRSAEVQATAPSPPPPPARTFGLNVTVSGPGRVSGGSSYASEAIFCGGATGTLLDCQQLFPQGMTVKLKAVRGKRGRFVRWTSFCTGRKPRCTLRVTAPKTVGAVFRRR
jgi:hypothetical protein